MENSDAVKRVGTWECSPTPPFTIAKTKRRVLRKRQVKIGYATTESQDQTAGSASMRG